MRKKQPRLVRFTQYVWTSLINADKITKCDKKRTLNFTQNESNVKKIKF